VFLGRGVPQIEVTFEVDANGILNVRAVDKGTGKSEKITITNDMGHLSQEYIERMVQEAEEFAEEDRKVKERIDARNRLETYVYNMKNQIGDKDKLADKIDSDDKETIDTALKEVLEWSDDNQTAEKEDYDEKLKRPSVIPSSLKFTRNLEDLVLVRKVKMMRTCMWNCKPLHLLPVSMNFACERHLCCHKLPRKVVFEGHTVFAVLMLIRGKQFLDVVVLTSSYNYGSSCYIGHNR
jgi:hypothetical protein